MDSLGWAVAHSLWQGALAAIAVYIFRSATRDSQASLRCGFNLTAPDDDIRGLAGTNIDRIENRRRNYEGPYLTVSVSDTF